MANAGSSSSLPAKPSSTNGPAKMHRKRSASPAVAGSASASTTPLKRESYVRKSDAPGADKLISKALHNVQTQKAASTPGPATPAAAATPASARAQFEQQEDFISFGDEFEEEERQPAKYQSGGRGASGTKRRRDDFDDEKRNEGTKRLAKREKERSTPWCDSPGVDWGRCENAVAM